jgi:DNA-binding NarL/FixJ family response regulator
MTAPPRTTIAIADDQPLFREGLRCLLAAEPDLSVVGTASDGQEAIDLVRSAVPDVLLLDLDMPRCPGLDVLRELAEPPVRTRTIVLAATTDDGRAVEALRLGARGILPKDTTLSLLVKCIRLVKAGQYWVGREAVSTLVSALRHVPGGRDRSPALFGLTGRQIEIIKALTTGATNRDIARQLGISEDTVKQHITTAFDKCGVSSRVELAMFATHHRLTGD